MAKVLFLLDASNPVNRIIRRGVIVAVASLVAVIANSYLEFAPAYAVPVIAAIGAMADKIYSEYKNVK